MTNKRLIGLILISLIVALPICFSEETAAYDSTFNSNNISDTYEGELYEKIDECNQNDGWFWEEERRCDESGYYYIADRYKDYELDDNNSNCVLIYDRFLFKNWTYPLDVCYTGQLNNILSPLSSCRVYADVRVYNAGDQDNLKTKVYMDGDYEGYVSPDAGKGKYLRDIRVDGGEYHKSTCKAEDGTEDYDKNYVPCSDPPLFYCKVGCKIACNYDSDCDDGNRYTDDKCHNAHNCAAYCTHYTWCGNGRCESDESCSSCSSDCGSCPYCGDGSCNNGETCSSCSRDCGTCAPYCGDGSCNNGETCSSCSHDCGCSPGYTCIGGSCIQSCQYDCASSCSDDNAPPTCWDRTVRSGYCSGNSICCESVGISCPVSCTIPDGSSAGCDCNYNSDCPSSNPYCEDEYPSPVSDGYDACLVNPPKYCGDGVCNNGETLQTCQNDCSSKDGRVYVDVKDSIGNPISGSYVYSDNSFKGTTKNNGKLDFSAAYGNRNIKVNCPDGSYCNTKSVYVNGDEYSYFYCNCNINDMDSDGDGWTDYEEEHIFLTDKYNSEDNFCSQFKVVYIANDFQKMVMPNFLVNIVLPDIVAMEYGGRISESSYTAPVSAVFGFLTGTLVGVAGLMVDITDLIPLIWHLVTNPSKIIKIADYFLKFVSDPMYNLCKIAPIRKQNFDAVSDFSYKFIDNYLEESFKLGNYYYERFPSLGSDIKDKRAYVYSFSVGYGIGYLIATVEMGNLIENEVRDIKLGKKLTPGSKRFSTVLNKLYESGYSLETVEKASKLGVITKGIAETWSDDLIRGLGAAIEYSDDAGRWLTGLSDDAVRQISQGVFKAESHVGESAVKKFILSSVGKRALLGGWSDESIAGLAHWVSNGGEDDIARLMSIQYGDDLVKAASKELYDFDISKGGDAFGYWEKASAYKIAQYIGDIQKGKKITVYRIVKEISRSETGSIPIAQQIRDTMSSVNPTFATDYWTGLDHTGDRFIGPKGGSLFYSFEKNTVKKEIVKIYGPSGYDVAPTERFVMFKGEGYVRGVIDQSYKVVPSAQGKLGTSFVDYMWDNIIPVEEIETKTLAQFMSEVGT
ncbi:MAG: hypothetical protein KJ561_06245 [Nanoarchaeota archaeon]|nr:hypothetical protein [Nanoarchaeota archaeon]